MFKTILLHKLLSQIKRKCKCEILTIVVGKFTKKIYVTEINVQNCQNGKQLTHWKDTWSKKVNKEVSDKLSKLYTTNLKKKSYPNKHLLSRFFWVSSWLLESKVAEIINYCETAKHKLGVKCHTSWGMQAERVVKCKAWIRVTSFQEYPPLPLMHRLHPRNTMVASVTLLQQNNPHVASRQDPCF